jgi:ubiquinone/menaquinone biosynthesis C-methylase UbiE
LTSFTPFAHAIGLDFNPHLITKAKDNNPDNVLLHWLLSDAMALPFRSSTHSFAISHFTLMWIPEVPYVLAEVHRVLRSQALFTAIEPDYSGRIEGSNNPQRNGDYPIVDWLLAKGADPFLGGQLPSKLHNAGFSEILFGILSWEYNATTAKEEIQDEANLLQAEGIQWKVPLFTYTPIFWITGMKE